MKILYIASSRIPSREANSVHVMKMCQAFQQEGHETTLLVPRLRGQQVQAFQNLKPHYGIETDFELKYFFSLPGLMGRDFCFRAAWFGRLRKYDLVFARYLGAGAWAARMGIPTVVELHDYPRDPLKTKYFDSFVHAHGEKRLVLITHKLKEKFLENVPQAHLIQSRFIVEPDGVDLERYEFKVPKETLKEDWGFPKNKISIGYAGHLYPGRGIEIVMALTDQFPHCEFYIAGGRDQDIDNYKKVKEEKGIKNLHFLGFLPNEKLPSFYQACDILLMPYQEKVSVSKGEVNTAEWMSPMKMFEYMASGTPLVSSDLPVLREVLNKENSILCPPADVASWKQAIESIEGNPEKAKEMALQAKEDVSQFTWRKRVSRIIETIP